MFKNRIKKMINSIKEKADENPEKAYQQIQRLDSVVQMTADSVVESFDVENKFEDLKVKELDNPTSDEVKQIVDMYEDGLIGDS